MRAWIGAGEEGRLVDEASAQVSVFDHGFTVGDGIFETMKSAEGQLFLWPWHLERLHRSAAAMRIALPSDELLTDVVRAVAGESATLQGGSRVRLTISAGMGPLGSSRLDTPPTIVCAASAMPVRKGDARLHVASWPRNERSPLAGVKSTSYAENVLALAEAEVIGAGEAIFCNTVGELCEGTGSNLFVVRAGHVITPPVSAGLLPGVTRRFVLSLADVELPICEQTVTRSDLDQADEVFITSTFQDVRGVCDIDGRSLSVGQVTRELQRRFRDASLRSEYWV